MSTSEPAILLTRRQVLQTATSGLGSIAMAALAGEVIAARDGASAKQPHFAARAKRVIFLCMRGGPSHVDLFDYKPELQRRSTQPSHFGNGNKHIKWLGSPFRFKQHGQSGAWISEVHPRLARHADQLCFIHSMNTDLPNHPQAFGQMHTGSFQFVRPSLGAWTLHGIGSENENLPGFVTLNPPADFGGAKNYGSAFLPSICQGTKIGGGRIPEIYAKMLGKTLEPGPPLPNLSNPSLTARQQRAQLDLVQAMNRSKLQQDIHNQEIAGAIESLELAFRMQSEIPHVLDLADEPKHILEEYGVGREPTDEFARQCVLARRLAEAGVRFVEITAPVNWDHHRLLKQQMETACQHTDRPIAALLTDLQRRGMLEDTLVIWAGEFGRTPYAQSGDGRDHNNKGYTTWMAGGGVKGGLSYGATDEFGSKAVESPVHVHDWHATILHLLGLDHEKLTYDYAGREFRLTDVYGEVVKEIIA